MQLTASQQAKRAGLDSLAEMERLSTVKRRTLDNWHKRKPELFEVVLVGCAKKKAQIEN